MAYSLEHVRLLILHESQDEAEQLMNQLRNAGKVTRAEICLDEEQFLKAVKSGTWELMLCRPMLADIGFAEVVAHLHRLGKNIPTIYLADNLDVEEQFNQLSLGARVVASPSHRELLMLLVDRQIEYLALRKELQRAQLALHDAEKRLSTLLAQSNDAIAYVVDGMHIHANDVYLEMFGYESADDLAGMPIMDMVFADDHEKLKKLLRSRQQNESQTNELECRCVGPDGSTFDATFVFSPSTYDGEACTQIVIRAQQVDAGVMEQEIQKIQQQDPITSLPNRSWIMAELDQAVVEAVKHSRTSSFFLVRLDDFERHQIAVGLDGADELLRQSADLLLETCGDDARLARIGGEDFALISPAADREEAERLGEKIRLAFEKLMPAVAGKTLRVTVSIGVSFVNEDSRSAQQVINKSIECCMRARTESNNQGNRVCVHSPLDDVEAGSAEAIALLVRDALENAKFNLQYQGIMSLNESSEHFFEVFVNLPQEDGSVLGANQFMPVAGELGLAGKVDRWVVLNAIKAMAALGQPVRLLINFTGYSLQDPGLAEWIGKAIKASKVNPASFVFQFTEVDINNHLKQAAAFIQQIHAQGAKAAISRFGGAQDSMRVFEHVTVDMVKFDRSYTQDIGIKESRDKLSALVSEVSDKGMEALVSYVETAGQMQALWTLGGVSYLQGFYLQSPAERMVLEQQPA